jgi:hypothetical protein
MRWWVLLCAVAAQPASAVERVAPGLCAADEVSYFACRTARDRRIALCGTSPQAVQYRYGRSGAVELQFPERAADAATQMLYSHYGRYQTERVELRFTNGGAEYVLFEYLEGKRRSAGVRVTAGAKERVIACAGRIDSRLGELEGALPCDADSALNLGACR